MSHWLIFTLAGTLILAPTLSRAGEPSQPPKPGESRVKAVRQMYAKLPCSVTMPTSTPAADPPIRHGAN